MMTRAFFKGLFLWTLMVSTALAQGAESWKVAHIKAEGNTRIEEATIKSYLGVNEGGTLTRKEAASALKSLYATGFFANVRLKKRGDTLVVEVIENPLVNRVAFEGNRQIETKDLQAETQLRPRSVFTRTKVQSDLKRILDLYRKSGRFAAKVEPKIITQAQNRVDLVYEIDEGDVTPIRDVLFVGNEHYSDSQLKEVIRSRQERWYRFWTDDDRYDSDRLSFDQELLRRYYVNHGYADFQVVSAIAELTPDGKGFYLTFTLDEGERYNFGDVNVKSSVAGVTPEVLNPLLTTQKGETFSAEEMEHSVDAIVKRMGDSGYAFVDVDPEPTRDPEKQTVGLTYHVQEGPKVYVERIDIVGNSRTLDEVIRREFRLAEGDPYSTSKLQRSEQRIKNLGYFESVKMSQEKGSAPDKVRIKVAVVEKSTGELTFGAGYSTLDGTLADVGIRESNLLGKGQDLRLRTTMATRRQEFDIGFTEPYFLDRELAAGFDAFKVSQDLRRESSYDRETLGGRLRMAYPFSEHLTHSVNYTLREDTISDIDADASIFIKEQRGTSLTSSVGHELIYDKRDNKFAPTEGYYVRFSQDLAGLGGDAHYIRDELRGGYFYPLASEWVLRFTGKAGNVTGLGEDVRINDRFFLGGRDIRGFRNAGIGPRDTTTASARDALGGKNYYAGSAEMGFPLGLPEEMGVSGAIFVDAGNLWSVDINRTSSMVGTYTEADKTRVSIGMGVAWSSPFGPIRLDVGFPLIKDEADITQPIRFDFGTRF